MDSEPKQYVRPVDASQHLLNRWGIRASVATLAKYRHLGIGPRFRRVQRDIVYDVGALDAWAQSRLSPTEFGSTAEAAAAAA